MERYAQNVAVINSRNKVTLYPVCLRRPPCALCVLSGLPAPQHRRAPTRPRHLAPHPRIPSMYTHPLPLGARPQASCAPLLLSPDSSSVAATRHGNAATLLAATLLSPDSGDAASLGNGLGSVATARVKREIHGLYTGFTRV